MRAGEQERVGAAKPSATSTNAMFARQAFEAALAAGTTVEVNWGGRRMATVLTTPALVTTAETLPGLQGDTYVVSLSEDAVIGKGYHTWPVEGRRTAGVFDARTRFPEVCCKCGAPVDKYQVVEWTEFGAGGAYNYQVGDASVDRAAATQRVWFAVPFCRAHSVRDRALTIQSVSGKVNFAFSSGDFAELFRASNGVESVTVVTPLSARDALVVSVQLLCFLPAVAFLLYLWLSWVNPGVRPLDPAHAVVWIALAVALAALGWWMIRRDTASSTKAAVPAQASSQDLNADHDDPSAAPRWLVSYLIDCGRPVRTSEVLQAAEAAGYPRQSTGLAMRKLKQLNPAYNPRRGYWAPPVEAPRDLEQLMAEAAAREAEAAAREAPVSGGTSEYPYLLWLTEEDHSLRRRPSAANSVFTLVIGVAALAAALPLSWLFANEGVWAAQGPAKTEARRQLLDDGVPAAVVDVDCSGGPLRVACDPYPIVSETEQDLEIEITDKRWGLSGEWGGSSPLVTFDGVPSIEATTHGVDWLLFSGRSDTENVIPHVDAVIPALPASLEGQILEGEASATITTPNYADGGNQYYDHTDYEARSVRLLVVSRDQFNLLQASYPDLSTPFSWAVLGTILIAASLAAIFLCNLSFSWANYWLKGFPVGVARWVGRLILVPLPIGVVLCLAGLLVGFGVVHGND